MPRNQEVIRQWRVLHALESSRHGIALDTLAKELEVTTRTIRRDLAALQEAGFPLYDTHDENGRVRWRLDGQVLKGLETGFTLPELCALYLSRNLLESVAGNGTGGVQSLNACLEVEIDQDFTKVEQKCFNLHS